jgi:transcriptional regulator with XRE-family HTH domain
MENSVQNRLKMFREVLGLSQKAMADNLDISQRTYANYELDRVPPAPILEKLVQNGLNLNWLFTGIGDMLGDSISSGAKSGNEIIRIQKDIEKMEELKKLTLGQILEIVKP